MQRRRDGWRCRHRDHHGGPTAAGTNGPGRSPPSRRADDGRGARSARAGARRAMLQETAARGQAIVARMRTGPDARSGASTPRCFARYAAGDQAAARALTARHAPRVFALARRMLGDVAEAEDVTQETMLRLWKIAPGLAGRPGGARHLALPRGEQPLRSTGCGGAGRARRRRPCPRSPTRRPARCAGSRPATGRRRSSAALAAAARPAAPRDRAPAFRGPLEPRDRRDPRDQRRGGREPAGAGAARPRRPPRAAAGRTGVRRWLETEDRVTRGDTTRPRSRRSSPPPAPPSRRRRCTSCRRSSPMPPTAQAARTARRRARPPRAPRLARSRFAAPIGGWRGGGGARRLRRARLLARPRRRGFDRRRRRSAPARPSPRRDDPVGDVLRPRLGGALSHGRAGSPAAAGCDGRSSPRSG